MVCRRPPGRTSAPCRTVQSRAPRSGLTPDYATLIRIAAPLHDASTTRGTEAASTLTLPPKRRGRESTGGCQVLRFAACLTRPDGTSARTLRQPSPVETTHPHRTERRFGLLMVPRAGVPADRPHRRTNIGRRDLRSRAGSGSPRYHRPWPNLLDRGRGTHFLGAKRGSTAPADPRRARQLTSEADRADSRYACSDRHSSPRRPGAPSGATWRSTCPPRSASA